MNTAAAFFSNKRTRESWHWCAAVSDWRRRAMDKVEPATVDETDRAASSKINFRAATTTNATIKDRRISKCFSKVTFPDRSSSLASGYTIPDHVFPGHHNSTQVTSDNNGQSRKCRRGIIEKRRRDKINNSLSELRRLIPAAFETQGSQKLEKADILQMAVQCVRNLAVNGCNIRQDASYSAAGYYSMGFRFCASEVDQFLANEGVHLHHQLRSRLSDHLQCFGAQRNTLNAVTHNSHQRQYCANSECK